MYKADRIKVIPSCAFQNVMLSSLKTYVLLGNTTIMRLSKFSKLSFMWRNLKIVEIFLHLTFSRNIYVLSFISK